MYFICKKVSRRKNNGSRFARRVVLTMVGEGVGVARILLRGHPSVANESGCICMSRATNMFIVILTQSARNQQRVKATASPPLPPPSSSAPSRGICMRKRIATSARIVALGQRNCRNILLQPRARDSRAPGGYDDSRK